MSHVILESKYKNLIQAASTDSKRGPIMGVHFDTTKSRAVATDGRILAIVPVQVAPNSTPFTITPEAFKSIKKGKSESHITEDFVDTVPYAPQLERYPNYAQVIPKASDKTISISFDATLLARLAKAIGSTQVTVTFNPEDPHMVFVVQDFRDETQPYNFNDTARGILMGIRKVK
jgi:DNA polymerase III sliding clamp (beta) subunit (PCNA family)